VSVKIAVVVLSSMLIFGAHAQAQQTSLSDCGSLDGRQVPTSYRALTTTFDATVTAELISRLGSASEEAHWTCWAGLLGALGDKRAVDALIDFIERPGLDRLSRDHTLARNEAIRALGFFLNRTGDERALRYLIDGLTPSVWRLRNVRGMATWSRSYAEYDKELSSYALFGLALSGNPRAGEALRSLQQSPTAQQAEFRGGLDDTLAQWLQVFALVVERGLAGTYEYYETQRQLAGPARPR